MSAGPVAVGSAWWRIRGVWDTRRVFRLLVVRDLKVRYAGSALGWVWSVLDPLLMAAVYWFVFTVVLDQSFGISHAGNVDARRGIALRSEPDVHLVIADAGTVTPPVGNVFEDGGNGLASLFGKKQACCEPPPVPHRNPGKLRDFHPVVKFSRRHAPAALTEIPQQRVALN